MTWPRGWALAEVLLDRTFQDGLGTGSATCRTHFVRADQAQINYARSMYNAIVTPYYTEDGVLEIKLDSEPGNLDIYYTFDNTTPTTSLRNMKLRSEYPRMRLGYVLSLIGTTSRLAKL